jgi:hypothetical protein
LTSTMLIQPQSQIAIDVTFPEALLDYDKKLKKKLPGTMRRIAMEGKSFWKSEAGRKLKSARKPYQDGIDYKVVDELSFYLTLTGFLAVSVDQGGSGFDMKPGFMRSALPWPPKRRRFPRALAETFAPKAITRYRIIPLNVNHYVNMQKPKVFRTVHDQSPAASWVHPGWKGMKISESVMKELDTKIIPKHMTKLLGEL